MDKRKMLTLSGAAAVFLLALGLTLYPVLSNAYNDRHQSKIHTQYQEFISNTNRTELTNVRNKAIAYNLSLIPGAQNNNAFSQMALMQASEDYGDQLDIIGDGTMGYVEIPLIGVQLPILHGTDSDTLEMGIGHLMGSSLPVGGENTHTVLTAHSGMATRKMFSDLDQLKLGDVFFLQVLGETLAYQVDQIETVLPHDTSFLGITEGEDQATLVTCTPFGINTHRLLVRGSRIEYEEANEIMEKTTVTVKPISTWEQQYRRGVMLGLTGVGILGGCAWVLLRIRRKRYG